MSSKREIFINLLERSGLLSAEQLEQSKTWQGQVKEIAEQVVRREWITPWQVQQLLRGRTAFELKRYVLLEQIGEGGMGAVFKARKRGMDRLVAIKLMKNEGVDKIAQQRFLREIATLGAVHHPNIVAALDADQIGEQTFLVMEYVEGKDLKSWLTDFGRLPLDWACEVIMQSALGLQHAHEKGLVHRDIKPANILIVSGLPGEIPQAKILDLGLARFTEENVEGNLTQTGQVMGTVDYMSPEQARSTKHVDIRADIFSLGCTLFKLLSGEVPFAGSNVMEKLMARTRPAPLLSSLRSDIPPVLDQILARMLAVSPKDRYATPLEVAQALAPFSMSQAGVSDESSSLVVQPAAPTVLDLSPAPPGDSQVEDFLAQLATQDPTSPPAPQETTLPFVSTPPPPPNRLPLFLGIPGGLVVLLILSYLLFPSTPPSTSPSVTIPLPTQFPLTPEEAKTSQQRWAEYLQEPVERTNTIGMKLMLIPPGKFMMGSPETEKERDSNRETQVEVTLTQGFWLGKYEVTQSEYERVMGKNPSTFKLVAGQDKSRFPVETVNWMEVEEYCRKLTEQERAAGRLPQGWE